MSNSLDPEPESLNLEKDARTTIVDCAVRALRSLAKPSSIEEIYSYILKNNLYDFNTSVPEHVLRTCIRRHTVGAGRVDMSDEILFEVDSEAYQLLETGKKRRTQVGMKRIQRAKDKATIIEALITDSDVQGQKTPAPFKEIWRLLLFSALVGFKAKRREPLTQVDPGRGIDQSSFGNSPSWPGILYLVGLVETSTTDPLASSESAEAARIQIFEEYANGGLAILREKCGHSEPDLRFLIEFVNEEIFHAPLPSPDLKIAI